MEYLTSWLPSWGSSEPALKELPVHMKREMWAYFETRGTTDRAEGKFDTQTVEEELSDHITTILDERTPENIWVLVDYLVSHKPFLEEYDGAAELEPILKLRMMDFAARDGVKCAWHYAFLWPDDTEGEQAIRDAYKEWHKSYEEESLE